MTNSFAEQSVLAFQTALTTLAGGLASFVPRLIVALFAFIVLWFVAVSLGRIIEHIIKALKLDSLLEGVGIEEPLSRAGYKLNTGVFFGGLVRWFFTVLALLVTVDILQLTAKKIFGKKLFRVAPLHHHFEALGWPSYKVTMRYWVVGVVVAIIGMVVALL